MLLFEAKKYWHNQLLINFENLQLNYSKNVHASDWIPSKHTHAHTNIFIYVCVHLSVSVCRLAECWHFKLKNHYWLHQIGNGKLMNLLCVCVCVCVLWSKCFSSDWELDQEHHTTTTPTNDAWKCNTINAFNNGQMERVYSKMEWWISPGVWGGL